MPARTASLVVDYTPHFLGALAAQGRGPDFLVVSRLDHPTRARLDGKPAQYEVIYRWLSRSCVHPDDGAPGCVRGSETTYWTRRELGPGFFRHLTQGTLALFDLFRLCP